MANEIGHAQDDAYAERRAQNDQQFAALPPAGSAAYWRAIEAQLPLEVLCRCIRERYQAGAIEDAQRAFEVLIRRIQRRTQVWAATLVGKIPAARGGGYSEDLQNDCYLAIWSALTHAQSPFLLEHFTRGLEVLEQKVAQRSLESQGYRTRRGVVHPTRVPSSQLDSLDATRPGAEGNEPLVPEVEDVRAKDAYTHADDRMLIGDVIGPFSEEERTILFQYFCLGRTHKEIGALYSLTPDAIRHRITNYVARLKIGLADPHERQEDSDARQ